MRELVWSSSLLIITIRFICGETEICSTIRRTQNIMHIDCLQNFILLFICVCVCMCVCVFVCVCECVCVCVCVCVYSLPLAGFFRLQDVCNIHTCSDQGSFVVCVTKGFCQVPSSPFPNLSYFISKDVTPACRKTAEKTIWYTAGSAKRWYILI